ncbi:hypothetical protein [Nannocystis exedens]|uniref:hypothetical protein n=1 Tax=Nannocystis exedens TaxID=54 RepID=UPI000BD5EF97|nr:hypothetical protein [Nannocystis exedens]PCC66449.1 hypothetical protein NAEX_09037 [Nannocystis exedens]
MHQDFCRAVVMAAREQAASLELRALPPEICFAVGYAANERPLACEFTTVRGEGEQ